MIHSGQYCTVDTQLLLKFGIASLKVILLKQNCPNCDQRKDVACGPRPQIDHHLQDPGLNVSVSIWNRYPKKTFTFEKSSIHFEISVF